MPANNNSFTVFEHEALYVHKGDRRLDPVHLKALQLFYKEKDFPYYSLVHNGVRFCEYVGVICVGKLTIEVLPKADRSNNQVRWKRILIDMMRSIGLFSPEAPSYSDLRLKNSSILELYLELFITEMELLIHKGLIKKYRSKEVNGYALRGKLLVGKQIMHNHVHQERFYIKQTVYDKEHLLHQLLYKTLITVMKIGLDNSLSSRYSKVTLDFPEQRDVKITESLFEMLIYDRKSHSYQKAIDIAKIILLNFHPDLSKGKSHVLALMFDMNDLWEKFVLKSLQAFGKEFVVTGQDSSDFWSWGNRRVRTIRPDIVIKKDDKVVAVLDTKWKNIKNFQPTDDDLRQLYAYSRYNDNAASFLVYPGESTEGIHGRYYKTAHEPLETTGGVIVLKVEDGQRSGQSKLCSEVLRILT